MQYRPLVFRVAYDILGSVVDAEDVVQHTYLRWHDIMGRDEPPVVDKPGSYLAQIAAHQSLNMLRRAKQSRETYIGPWLPEPLPDSHPTIASATTPEDAVEIGDEVSLALMVVLESLGAEERVAFVLHDIFGEPYRAVAQLLEKNEPAVRQLVHRARQRVQSQRLRQVVTPEEHNQVVEQFALAVLTGDFVGLTNHLAPDVVLISDGGGNARAAIKPVVGVHRVTKFIESIVRNYSTDTTSDFVVLNGQLGVVTREGDHVIATFQFNVVDDKVHGIYAGRNPEKLTALG